MYRASPSSGHRQRLPRSREHCPQESTTVFLERKKRFAEAKRPFTLTFDCLLNCWTGSAVGSFTIITPTTQQDRPGLGQRRQTPRRRRVYLHRPGRIDRPSSCLHGTGRQDPHGRRILGRPSNPKWRPSSTLKTFGRRRPSSERCGQIAGPVLKISHERAPKNLLNRGWRPAPPMGCSTQVTNLRKPRFALPSVRKK